MTILPLLASDTLVLKCRPGDAALYAGVYDGHGLGSRLQRSGNRPAGLFRL